MENPLRAIIWDYDCTLANTWHKNMIVTRKIVSSITGEDTRHIPALTSVEAYRRAAARLGDWRTFYMEEFGLTAAQTNEAGKSWTAFQLQEITPVEIFDGLKNVLHTLSHIPHGVVSLNSKAEISQTLDKEDLAHYFKHIVGYEDVAFDRQKPEPDALLLCIEQMLGSTPGLVLYIGDHEVDAACVVNANTILQQHNIDIRIRSIGAFYGCCSNIDTWAVKPDYHADTTTDIIKIVHALDLQQPL
ncbi:hypothetical protein CSA56_12875 [candidate division KSB3 bacterium]|uniref:Haloacid dehalogenase n=1 Tax=candidate division KSB3 bacterium TaxID=2044937 RepID=A0A2G6KEH9_9BACT|nr:MAG: hypothetical protein CSA56_12875 [candidate division KSB3 bacterium]